MYISIRNKPLGVAKGRIRGKVPQTVFVLGFVSLLTDISTEMITAVIPLFVTVGLGLSPLAFGFLDSVYQAGTAISRVVGGYVADRFEAPKRVALAGYGLGAISKLALIPVTTVAGLTAAIGVDRIGKGLRTGPRDALIAGATPGESLGQAFGVHRALDTTGALLGPVVAFLLLMNGTGEFSLVFTVSACTALLGVILLHTKVASPGKSQTCDRARNRERSSTLVGAVKVMVSQQSLRRLLSAAALLSIVTISDAFLYLVLLDRGLVSATAFPLLFIGTSLVYLATAIPVGRLSDRVGRRRIFLLGHVGIVIAYILANIAGSVVAVLGVLVSLGLYYAATDGVLPAATSELVPAEWRSTSISVVQTVVALGRSLAALLFGALWAVSSSRLTLAAFAIGLTIAVVVSAALLNNTSPNRG